MCHRIFLLLVVGFFLNLSTQDLRAEEKIKCENEIQREISTRLRAPYKDIEEMQDKALCSEDLYNVIDRLGYGDPQGDPSQRSGIEYTKNEMSDRTIFSGCNPSLEKDYVPATKWRNPYKASPEGLYFAASRYAATLENENKNPKTGKPTELANLLEQYNDPDESKNPKTYCTLMAEYTYFNEKYYMKPCAKHIFEQWKRKNGNTSTGDCDSFAKKITGDYIDEGSIDFDAPMGKNGAKGCMWDSTQPRRIIEVKAADGAKKCSDKTTSICSGMVTCTVSNGFQKAFLISSLATCPAEYCGEKSATDCVHTLGFNSRLPEEKETQSSWSNSREIDPKRVSTKSGTGN